MPGIEKKIDTNRWIETAGCGFRVFRQCMREGVSEVMAARRLACG